MIAIGEILASVASYQFFYTEVPLSMRSATQALNLLSVSFGALLTSEFITIFGEIGW